MYSPRVNHLKNIVDTINDTSYLCNKEQAVTHAAKISKHCCFHFIDNEIDNMCVCVYADGDNMILTTRTIFYRELTEFNIYWKRIL